MFFFRIHYVIFARCCVLTLSALYPPDLSHADKHGAVLPFIVIVQLYTTFSSPFLKSRGLARTKAPARKARVHRLSCWASTTRSEPGWLSNRVDRRHGSH
jgi:hypothetical protein